MGRSTIRVSAIRRAWVRRISLGLHCEWEGAGQEAGGRSRSIVPVAVVARHDAEMAGELEPRLEMLEAARVQRRSARINEDEDGKPSSFEVRGLRLWLWLWLLLWLLASGSGSGSGFWLLHEEAEVKSKRMRAIFLDSQATR